MATRYVGRAIVRATLLNGQTRTPYEVVVSCPGVRAVSFRVSEPSSGFGPGVGPDCPAAYDDIASAAAHFAAMQSAAIAKAIAQAYDPAGSNRLYVRRAKGGRGRLV